MNDIEIAFQPRLSFLAESDKEKIYHAALKVLEDTGMRLLHEDARRLLRDAGCPVEDETVRIPSRLVEKAVQSTPSSVAIYNREGELAMDLGGRRAYFGTGSDLMYHIDAGGKRHQTSLKDIQRSAFVADALPNIDFIMSFAHPHELNPNRAYIESFLAMTLNSVKPIVNTAKGRHDLKAMWEVAKVLRGGENQLRDKPCWIQYAEPISPLKHPFDSVDKLLFCAETRMPVIYSPAPIAGSTAPMTLAGHVVQGLAECFFGLVIHQLTAEEAPFLMGMGAAVLDMATSQCSYNAPEYLMAYMAMVEMSNYFDIPNWGYAGTSDSQLPDGQATFEAGLLSFMAAFAGSNLNHDVGYLDFGLTGSLEMMVILDEMIDQIRRMQKGIPIDEDQLGLETIAAGAAQGQFLTQPHTLKHLRSTQWRPRLINRFGFEQWKTAGETTLLDRGKTRLNQILDTHEVKPLDDRVKAEIQGIVNNYKERK